MSAKMLSLYKGISAGIIIVCLAVLSITVFKYIEYMRDVRPEIVYQANHISNTSANDKLQSVALDSGNAPKANKLNSVSTLSYNTGTTNSTKVQFNNDQARTKKGTLPILMYHSINDKPFGDKELFVSTRKFDEQMKYLHDNGYTTIDFSDIENYKKYKKPIIVTFDDGYEDNYTNAYPVLKKYGLKATVFVVTGFIGKNNYLTSDQVKQMKDIISFQSHTLSHISLNKANNYTLERECSESRNEVEKLTGKSVVAIAYPYGAYNTGVANIAKKYYKYGLCTEVGYYSLSSGFFNINRIAIGPSTSMNIFAQIID